MAWNEVRISMLPAGMRPTVTTAPLANGPGGSPVSIVGTAPATSDATTPIAAEALRDWFLARGMTVATDSATAIDLARVDTTVFLAVTGGQATEVVVTVTLDGASLSRLRSWKQLVTQLHHEWDLQLVDPQAAATVSIDDFERLLANSHAWRDLAAAHHWPTTIQPWMHSAHGPAMTDGPTLDAGDVPPLPSPDNKSA
jgi:hypothetical protein